MLRRGSLKLAILVLPRSFRLICFANTHTHCCQAALACGFLASAARRFDRALAGEAAAQVALVCAARGWLRRLRRLRRQRERRVPTVSDDAGDGAGDGGGEKFVDCRRDAPSSHASSSAASGE